MPRSVDRRIAYSIGRKGFLPAAVASGWGGGREAGEETERLRLEAEEFQGTVEEELRKVCARIEELRVRQAKRRGPWKMNGRR